LLKGPVGFETLDRKAQSITQPRGEPA